MNDRFQSLQLFIRVAETASFSRAGRELGYGQPSVSKMISTLEARLGVRLLARTTRRVSLTEAGQVFLERARVVMAALDEAEAAPRGDGGLTGLLRVATPVTFGARVIGPATPGFLEAHPRLRLELLMADRRVDLLEEGVDLAIRMGALADSSLVSRRIAISPRWLVASPGYLARRGVPTSPDGLAGHDIVSVQPPGLETLHFSHAGGGAVSVRLQARLVVTAVEGQVAAVMAGAGLAALSDFASRPALDLGTLVTLLPGYALPPVEVHAIFAAGHRPPAKARAFVEHLARTLD
jgi:DNA-binding transcriptional LysR family regulator